VLSTCVATCNTVVEVLASGAGALIWHIKLLLVGIIEISKVILQSDSSLVRAFIKVCCLISGKCCNLSGHPLGLGNKDKP